MEETKPENKEINLIDKANEAAQRIELANENLAKNLARQERMLVEMRLSGKAEAGQPAKTEEETPESYALRVMANDLENVYD